MDDPRALVPLAERVAEVARGLGIETALIGAAALAVHHYIRATGDVDLATHVDPRTELPALERSLHALGVHAVLVMPDEDDPLGGLVRVWEHEDRDGGPVDPIEIVNFYNPYRPALTPAREAIQHAVAIEGSTLRCVRLADLIALKLYAGSLRDAADVVDVLVRNPGADLDQIRATCKQYGFETRLEELIAAATPAG